MKPSTEKGLTLEKRCILDIIEVTKSYKTDVFLLALLRIAGGLCAHIALKTDEDMGWRALSECEKQLRNDFAVVLEDMKKNGYPEK